MQYAFKVLNVIPYLFIGGGWLYVKPTVVLPLYWLTERWADIICKTIERNSYKDL